MHVQIENYWTNFHETNGASLYRGWGAPKFPIPYSDFPLKLSNSTVYFCITFPHQSCLVFHLLIIKSVILYEIVSAKMFTKKHTF